MQLDMGAFNVVPKTAPIAVTRPEASVDLVDVVGNAKKIATDFSIPFVIAELPANMPAHAIEMIDFFLEPVRPRPGQPESVISLVSIAR